MPRIGPYPQLAGVTTRRNAMKAAAATAASVALSSTVIASEQTTCAIRYAEYQKARAICAEAMEAHIVASGRRVKMTPPVPAELIVPVQAMSYWNDIAVCVVPERDPNKPLRRYFDVTALEKFIGEHSQPVPERKWHVIHDAIEYAHKALPVAREHKAAVDHAMDASGENAAWTAYETAHDREHDAVTALMNAPIERFSDFRFKASVMRDLLDDGLEVESETEDLTNQILEFFAVES